MTIVGQLHAIGYRVGPHGDTAERLPPSDRRKAAPMSGSGRAIRRSIRAPVKASNPPSGPIGFAESYQTADRGEDAPVRNVRLILVGKKAQHVKLASKVGAAHGLFRGVGR